MRNSSTHPRYGTCWTRALARLDATCSALTDRSQSELAQRFGKCFMDMTAGDHQSSQSGDAPNETAGDADLWCAVGDHGCMRRLPDRHFAAFQQFFAATGPMCYLVQGQRWDEETRQHIEALRDQSQRVHRRMESAGRVQKAMLAQQLEQMALQKEAKADGLALRETLVEGRRQVEEMATEWRLAADEQRLVMGEVFGRLGDLHGWLVAEGAWTGRWAWWTACGAGVWCVLAATGDRAMAARWKMMAMCLVGAWLDGTLWPWMMDGMGERRAYEWIWTMRKVFVGAMVVMWFATVVRYADRREERLVRIEQRQLEMLQMLQRLTVPPGNKSKIVEDDKSNQLVLRRSARNTAL